MQRSRRIEQVVATKPAQLQGAHEQALATVRSERDAAATAAAEAHAEEIARLHEERDALQARIAKLQALVDESAAAHKAHAELKELKLKHKCASSCG